MIAKGLGAAVAVLLMGTSVLAQEIKSGDITVVSPWARATPGGAKVGGAYLELKAAAGAGDKLVSASSPAAGTVEIHEHAHEGGVMKMRRIDGLAVPGGGTVALKPGGYHLMLMDLKQPLKQGETVKLDLVFEKAGKVAVEAKIAPIGAASPDGTKSQAPKGGGGHKHH